MGAVTLEQVRDDGSGESYPRLELEGCRTALVLFAAAFYGRQDAYWLADAGLRATCVDIDLARLQKMQRIYPADWHWVVGDAYAYAGDRWRRGARYDVVSLDPNTNQFDHCAEMLAMWCTLARRLVVLGAAADTYMRVPDGWELVDMRKRSRFQGGVYWAVFAHD